MQPHQPWGPAGRKTTRLIAVAGLMLTLSACSSWDWKSAARGVMFSLCSVASEASCRTDAE